MNNELYIMQQLRSVESLVKQALKSKDVAGLHLWQILDLIEQTRMELCDE